jgi:AcrR family transcriptional regulator
MKNTKEHILKIALGLFLRKSFKEVTMNEIVKKTEMSKGAFYHYFESKEQLFLEILNSYFVGSMVLDYSKLSKDSLYQFSRDYISEITQRLQISEKKQNVSLSNVNFYFLIFDGAKRFPEFRKKMRETQEIEQKAWENIVGIARKKREIMSKMTDEQIAKLFIYVTDGVGIHLIMDNKIGQMMEEVSFLWGGLYDQLKA